MTNVIKTKAEIEQDRQKLYDQLKAYPFPGIEIYYTLTDYIDPYSERQTAINIQPFYTEVKYFKYKSNFCQIKVRELTELDHSNLPPQVIAASKLVDENQNKYYAQVSIKPYQRHGGGSWSFGFVNANRYEKFRIDKIDKIVHFYKVTTKVLERCSNRVEQLKCCQIVLKNYKILLKECQLFMEDNLAHIYLDGHYKVREILRVIIKDLEKAITVLNEKIKFDYKIKQDYLETNKTQLYYHHRTESNAHNIIKKAKLPRNKAKGFGDNLGFIFDLEDYLILD